MSEYQYYEFQKVDERLSPEEMRELRSYSTRARITPSSFTNEYNFGNFKGDPDFMMEKYFDGFLYFANWGTREVQLAVPAGLLPAETAHRYDCGYAASSRKKSGKLIVKFASDQEPDEEWIEEEGQLASLLQIRNELIQGDLRSLYLGWLVGVQAGELEESEKEPPVPPNLDKLSGPQQNLADFLRVDAGLLAVAARNSPRVKTDSTSSKELSTWIATLPARKKDEILVQLVKGNAAKAGQEIQSRFRRHQGASQPAAGLKPRTVAELLSAK